VSDVFEVCTTQLGSPPGARLATPIEVPSRRRADHMTFVQVHTASLAWAPFNAGCEKPGSAASRMRGQDKDKDLRSSW
jgi:hypothetical protein